MPTIYLIRRLTALIGGGVVQDDVIDFEDHLDKLSGEMELLSFGQQRVKHALLAHVNGPLSKAIDAQIWIVIIELSLLGGGQVVNWREARIFC